MKRIGIIFGGRSGEHEISLLSATSAIKEIDRNKYEIVMIGITKTGKWKHFEGDIEMIATGEWEEKSEEMPISSICSMIDFAFPVMHGPYGEDGTIQGLFEMMDIPYAGCGVLSSSLCMDKVSAKQIFDKNEIPTCRYHLVYSEDVQDDIDSVIEEIEKNLTYNVFVKPSNMGSSVGISKAKNREELKSALALASKYDRRIIIEKAVEAREVEVGVIGNCRPKASAVGEIIAKSEFYDYTAKYTDDAGTELSIPAKLSKDIYERIREMAIDAYKALDCAGFARLDFFIDKNNGEIFINEINTIPGFTKYSMFPTLWREAGIPFRELIERIVDFGYERYNVKNNR